MNGAQRFEDLLAWQKARVLIRDTYCLTRREPFCRDFALANQIHKSAISILSNIAEGFGRYRHPEFRQFLTIANASCAELRSQLYIAADLGYIDNEALEARLQQAEEVGRLIGKLRSSLST